MESVRSIEIGTAAQSEFKQERSSDTQLSGAERLHALSGALELLRLELLAARDSDGSSDLVQSSVEDAADAATPAAIMGLIEVGSTNEPAERAASTGKALERSDGAGPAVWSGSLADLCDDVLKATSSGNTLPTIQALPGSSKYSETHGGQETSFAERALLEVQEARDILRGLLARRQESNERIREAIRHLLHSLQETRRCVAPIYQALCRAMPVEPSAAGIPERARTIAHDVVGPVVKSAMENSAGGLAGLPGQLGTEGVLGVAAHRGDVRAAALAASHMAGRHALLQQTVTDMLVHRRRLHRQEALRAARGSAGASALSAGLAASQGGGDGGGTGGGGLDAVQGAAMGLEDAAGSSGASGGHGAGGLGMKGPGSGAGPLGLMSGATTVQQHAARTHLERLYHSMARGGEGLEGVLAAHRAARLRERELPRAWEAAFVLRAWAQPAPPGRVQLGLSESALGHEFWRAGLGGAVSERMELVRQWRDQVNAWLVTDDAYAGVGVSGLEAVAEANEALPARQLFTLRGLRQSCQAVRQGLLSATSQPQSVWTEAEASDLGEWEPFWDGDGGGMAPDPRLGALVDAIEWLGRRGRELYRKACAELARCSGLGSGEGARGDEPGNEGAVQRDALADQSVDQGRDGFISSEPAGAEEDVSESAETKRRVIKVFRTAVVPLLTEARLCSWRARQLVTLELAVRLCNDTLRRYNHSATMRSKRWVQTDRDCLGLPVAEEPLQAHQCRFLLVRAERAVRLAVTRRHMFAHAASVGAAEVDQAARGVQGQAFSAVSEPDLMSDADALRLAAAMRPTKSERQLLAREPAVVNFAATGRLSGPVGGGGPPSAVRPKEADGRRNRRSSGMSLRSGYASDGRAGSASSFATRPDSRGPADTDGEDEDYDEYDGDEEEVEGEEASLTRMVSLSRALCAVQARSQRRAMLATSRMVPWLRRWERAAALAFPSVLTESGDAQEEVPAEWRPDESDRSSRSLVKRTLYSAMRAAAFRDDFRTCSISGIPRGLSAKERRDAVSHAQAGWGHAVASSWKRCSPAELRVLRRLSSDDSGYGQAVPVVGVRAALRMIRRVSQQELPLVGEVPLSEWTASVQSHKSLRQLVQRDRLMMDALRRYLSLHPPKGQEGEAGQDKQATATPGPAIGRTVADTDALQGLIPSTSSGTAGGGAGAGARQSATGEHPVHTDGDRDARPSGNEDKEADKNLVRSMQHLQVRIRVRSMQLVALEALAPDADVPEGDSTADAAFARWQRHSAVTSGRFQESLDEWATLTSRFGGLFGSIDVGQHRHVAPGDAWSLAHPISAELRTRYSSGTPDGAAGTEWMRKSRKSETEGGFDSDEEHAGEEELDPEGKCDALMRGIRERMEAVDMDDEDSQAVAARVSRLADLGRRAGQQLPRVPLANDALPLPEAGWAYGKEDDVDLLVAMRGAMYGVVGGAGGSSGMRGGRRGTGSSAGPQWGHERMVADREQFESSLTSELMGKASAGEDGMAARVYREDEAGGLERETGDFGGRGAAAGSSSSSGSTHRDSKLPSNSKVVHPYDTEFPLPFTAEDRFVLDRGIGLAVGIQLGANKDNLTRNTFITHVHEPKHSLMPHGLYTGSDDHLRVTGVSFALVDLEIQRRMMLLVLGACGASRYAFVRTAAVRGSHAIVSHGFPEMGLKRSSAASGSEGGGLDAALNLTPVGDVVVLLRPTELGLAHAAAETGTPAQLAWNMDEMGECTGVPRGGREVSAGRDINTRWLGRSQLEIDGVQQRQRSGQRIGLPEATGGNGDRLLWWHTPYAAPFAPFTPAREYSALWRRFRVNPRMRTSALGTAGVGPGGNMWAKLKASSIAGTESLDEDLDSDSGDEEDGADGSGVARAPGQARGMDLSLGAAGQVQSRTENEAIAAASVAVAEAAQAEVEASAAETVFNPATRLNLLRHILMGMPWPDHHAPGLVQAACNPGTSKIADSALGGGVSTMTELDDTIPMDVDDVMARGSTPGGKTPWHHSDPGWALTTGIASAGPAQFQFLHDPEVVDRLEEVAQASLWHVSTCGCFSLCTDGPRESKESDGPVGAAGASDWLVFAAAQVLGYARARALAVTLAVTRFLAAFVAVFVIVRLVVLYLVQTSVLGEGTDLHATLVDEVGSVLRPSARNTTGDGLAFEGENVDLLGELTVSYLYAIGVILLAEPLMYQAARRSDALLRVLVGLPQSRDSATGPVRILVHICTASANALCCQSGLNERNWDRSAGVRSQITSAAGMHADLRGSSRITLGSGAAGSSSIVSAGGAATDASTSPSDGGAGHLGGDVGALASGIDATMRFGHAAALRDSSGQLCAASLPKGRAEAALEGEVSQLAAMPALAPRLVSHRSALQGSRAARLSTGEQAPPQQEEYSGKRVLGQNMVNEDRFAIDGWVRESVDTREWQLQRRRTQVSVLRPLPWWRLDREAYGDMYDPMARLCDWVVVVLLVAWQALVVGIAGALAPFLEEGEFDAAEAAVDRSLSKGLHTSATLVLLVLLCGLSTAGIVVVFRNVWKPYAAASADGTAPSQYAPLIWLASCGRGYFSERWTFLSVSRGTGRQHVNSSRAAGKPEGTDLLSRQIDTNLTQEQASDTVARSIAGVAQARAMAFARRYGARDLAHDQSTMVILLLAVLGGPPAWVVLFEPRVGASRLCAGQNCLYAANWLVATQLLALVLVGAFKLCSTKARRWADSRNRGDLLASACCCGLWTGCCGRSSTPEDIPYSCRPESRFACCRVIVRGVLPGYSKSASTVGGGLRGTGKQLGARAAQISLSLLGVLWGMWRQQGRIGGTSPGRDVSLDGRILRGRGHVDSVSAAQDVAASRALRHAIREGRASLADESATAGGVYSSTEIAQASTAVQSLASGAGSETYDTGIPSALRRDRDSWGSSVSLGLETASQLRSANPMLAGTVPWSSIFVKWQTDTTALAREVAVVGTGGSAWPGAPNASRAVSAAMLRRSHVLSQLRQADDMREELSQHEFAVALSAAAAALDGQGGATQSDVLHDRAGSARRPKNSGYIKAAVQGESRPVADPVALPQPLSDITDAVLDARHCEVLDAATRSHVVQSMVFDELRCAGCVPLVQRAVQRLRPASTDRGTRVVFEDLVGTPNAGKAAQDAHARVGGDLSGSAGSADKDGATRRQGVFEKRSFQQMGAPVELADSSHWEMGDQAAGGEAAGAGTGGQQSLGTRDDNGFGPYGTAPACVSKAVRIGLAAMQSRMQQLDAMRDAWGAAHKRALQIVHRLQKLLRQAEREAAAAVSSGQDPPPSTDGSMVVVQGGRRRGGRGGPGAGVQKLETAAQVRQVLLEWASNSERALEVMQSLKRQRQRLDEAKDVLMGATRGTAGVTRARRALWVAAHNAGLQYAHQRVAGLCAMEEAALAQIYAPSSSAACSADHVWRAALEPITPEPASSALFGPALRHAAEQAAVQAHALDGPVRRSAQVSVDHAVGWCMAASRMSAKIDAVLKPGGGSSGERGGGKGRGKGEQKGNESAQLQMQRVVDVLRQMTRAGSSAESSSAASSSSWCEAGAQEGAASRRVRRHQRKHGHGSRAESGQHSEEELHRSRLRQHTRAQRLAVASASVSCLAPRPMTVLGRGPSLLQRSTRLETPQVYDLAHSQAILLVAAMCVSLFAALPLPLAPILGLVLAFMEGRRLVATMVTRDRRTGTSADLEARDSFLPGLSYLSLLSMYGTSALIVFITVFDGVDADASQFSEDQQPLFIMVWLLLPLIVLIPMRICCTGLLDSVSGSQCFGNRRSPEELVRVAEVPYRAVAAQLFGAAQRLNRLWADESAGKATSSWQSGYGNIWGVWHFE